MDVSLLSSPPARPFELVTISRTETPSTGDQPAWGNQIGAHDYGLLPAELPDTARKALVFGICARRDYIISIRHQELLNLSPGTEPCTIVSAGIVYDGCYIVKSNDPRNPRTRAAIARVTYATISSSDMQEGGHNTEKCVREGGTLITKTRLHRFKKFLKDLGLLFL
jgi:hypothetical protein